MTTCRISPILHSLHWLPVAARIQCKVSSLCNSSLSDSFLNTCPGSCGFIHHRDNSVRPVTTAVFVFPPSKQKPLVKDPFSYAGPVIWNKIPYDIRTVQPICLARTTSLKIFVLFATPVAGWVSRLGYIFRAPSPSPTPFCLFVCLFVVFDQCCWLLYCCWLPSRALLS